MKLLPFLFLLTAGVCLAEQAKLPRNTVMRTGDSLVILKAGTVVQVIDHANKTVTVKVNGQTGTIPWSALDAEDSSRPMGIVTSAAPASAPAPAPAAAAAPAEAAPEHRPAQTMYGKAVEKARAAADSHDKAMVQPTDAILDGK